MESSVISSSVSSKLLSPFPQNSIAVGSTWMLSSMLLTTYYSTAFLKYNGKQRGVTSKNDFQNRQSQILASTSATTSTTSTTSASASNQIATQQKILTFLSKLYSRPQLLTIYRLSGSFLLGIFAHPQFFQWRDRWMKSRSVMKDFTLPAIFMFLANYCNVIALDRLGISLTYTSKCGIPILTVLITILVDGMDAIPSLLTLCSLIPIGVGIGMASWNTPTFDLYGFISAVISATSQASLNVSCKRALTKTRISGLQAQTTMAALAFCVAMISTTIHSMKTRLNGSTGDGNSDGQSDASSVGEVPSLPLTIGAVSSYHIEYVLSFLFLSLVKPITYGTCDAIRRLGIIISGRRMFGGDAFSWINYSGIGLALFGALCYSIASSMSK